MVSFVCPITYILLFHTRLPPHFDALATNIFLFSFSLCVIHMYAFLSGGSVMGSMIVEITRMKVNNLTVVCYLLFCWILKRSPKKTSPPHHLSWCKHNRHTRIVIEKQNIKWNTYIKRNLHCNSRRKTLNMKMKHLKYTNVAIINICCLIMLFFNSSRWNEPVSVHTAYW